jgi:hypothetical protein
LIQLAGAFVHIQKNRRGPAGALFRLAQANLAKYPATHHRLEVSLVQEFIEKWLAKLETPNEVTSLLKDEPALRLGLVSGEGISLKC